MAVEILVVIEVVAQIGYEGLPLVLLQRVGLDEFRLEDVFLQVILVPKVIVEGLAFHAVPLADVGDCNLFQGDCLHQILEGVHQNLFRYVRICHLPI